MFFIQAKGEAAASAGLKGRHNLTHGSAMGLVARIDFRAVSATHVPRPYPGGEAPFCKNFSFLKKRRRVQMKIPRAER